VVSDNVPFNCAEYREFAHAWGFEPIFISPCHSQGNEFAEKGVGIAKSIFKKSTYELDLALLQYRITPIPHINYSSLQLLNGRPLWSRIPVHHTVLKPYIPLQEEVLQKKKEALDQAASYYNRSTCPLQPLKPGNLVLVKRHLAQSMWKRVKILRQAVAPWLYIVKENQGGTTLHQN